MKRRRAGLRACPTACYCRLQEVAVHPGDHFQLDLLRADRFALADVGAAAEASCVDLRHHAHGAAVALGLALRQQAQVGDLGAGEQRGGRRSGTRPRRRRSRCRRPRPWRGRRSPWEPGWRCRRARCRWRREMKPPAAMMRSKALRSTTRSLITGNARARHGSRYSSSPSLKWRMCKLADRGAGHAGRAPRR